MPPPPGVGAAYHIIFCSGRSHLTWDTPGTRLRWGRLGDISGDSRGRYYPTTLSVLWLMKLIYEAVHRRSEYFCTARFGKSEDFVLYTVVVGSRMLQ